MHVVNTLEEGRRLLSEFSAGSKAGSCSPLAGEWEPASRSSYKLHLCSPPFAACYAGVNYYRKLVHALRAEFSGIAFEFTLDCGDDAAIAHDARRLGFTHIRCTSPLDPVANTAKP